MSETSYTTIKAAFTGAATMAGFATSNIYWGFDWEFNKQRGATRYPAIQCIPPKIAVVPTGKEYKTTLSIYLADYMGTVEVVSGNPPVTAIRDETETETWDRLTEMAYTFVSYMNSSQSNNVYVATDVPELTAISKGGMSVDNVYGVMLTIPIKVIKC